MTAPTATTVTAAAYTEIAADISALTWLQCPFSGPVDSPREGVGAELVAAAEAPAVTVRGVQLMEGQTMIADRIAEIGTSGKLYGRSVSWSPPVVVLTL